MATTQKAISLARDLAEEIQKRLPTMTVATSFDSDGNPLVSVDDGSPASGEASALIKVRPIDWPLAKDALGLASQVYTPHVIQLATEANYAATTDNVADNLTRAQLLAILGPCLQKGCRVEWYEETYGTPPAASTITGSKLKASYENLYYPMVQSQ